MRHDSLGTGAYLVTFVQVDPLFTIDLPDPYNPRILGELKIPGYSEYLHPYDETHIIGIGKEVDPSIDADKVHTPGAVYYTAILGLKLALFDVSDIENPVEEAKVVIGNRGTDSPALYHHKAFLSDREKELLVVPKAVPAKKYTADLAASLLREILENPVYADRASSLGDRVRAEDGAGNACRAIENFLAENLSVGTARPG